jgi:uncharacterized protein YaiE (UPF0345 family)
MRIDGSGNVGIGTASPVSDARLTVSSPTTESYVFFERSNSGVFDTAIGNNGGSTVFKGGANSSTVAGLSEFMRIDSSGNVGIGISSPAAKLQSQQTSGSNAFQLNTTTNGVGMYWVPTNGYGVQNFSYGGLFLMGTSDSNATVFQTNGSERMRIDSSGNLLVGTTTTGSVGISLSASYNLGWGQNSGESVPNIFRQASSAATVMANGYRNSATANGFASSLSSSYAKSAISCGTVAGGITFYTDTAAAVAAGTDVTPTERMRINSSGDVMIGAATPLNAATGRGYLLVNGASTSLIDFGVGGSSVGYLYHTGTDLRVYNDEAGALQFYTNATERMRITSGGDVGIGVTGPSDRLDVAGSNSRVRWGLSTTSVTQVASNVAGNAFANAVYDAALHAWSTSSTERMRLTSAGNLLVGATSSNHKLFVADSNDRAESTSQFSIQGAGYSAYHFLDGTAYYIGQNSNSRSLRMYSGGNPAVGVNLAAGGNSWGTYSDERVKDIIEPIEGGVEKLLHLRTVIGKYKFDETNKRRVFLIAQDVQSVLPEAVSEDESGSLSLQYQDLIPVLVKAIQEQQTIITDLTTRLTALENK